MIKNTKRKLIAFLVVTFLLSIWTVTVFAENDHADNGNENAEDVVETESEEEVVEEEVVETANDVELPNDKDFETVTENDTYILKADPETGHFIVHNKSTDKILRSYPEPDAWDEEKVAGSWQSHLKSPFMFSYVELNERRDVVKESNLLNNTANVDFEKIDNGFKVTYEMPDLGFVFPIEVLLEEDYVETRVLADDIKDEKEYSDEESDKDPMARLVSLRLFPFLGADDSTDKDGFIFLPDGTGVLVDFKDNRASTTNLFSERIYGDDLAFSAKATLSSRLPVRMPVFGIKSNDQAVLGIVHEGDTYANIVSAPSESFSQYNWVTGEHLFRFKVFQATDKQRTEGFFTYSEDIQRTNRSIRYYMIEEEDSNYVDMAQRYRKYLMEEQGLERTESEDNPLKLHLNILGGGIKTGFLWDSYLPLTTIDQSMEIIDGLGNLGVEDMAITYHGWNKGGYGTFGGHFPVAKQLGGNDKMEELTNFAHSKGYPVYLEASTYTYNNNGKDGFRANRDGLRDLASTVMRFYRAQNDAVLVSPRFMEEVIYDDLEEIKDLGVNGLLFGDGIGSTLSTDYNERYLAERHEVKEIQQNIITKSKQELGDVHLTEGNFYTLADVTHIDQMDNDYSYDLYVDRKIPFAQIVLHGLVSYSFEYGNMSGNAQESFLKGIEYGATPSFLVTYEESHKLLESRSMYRFYSTYYKDWEEEIAIQYQRFNDALADVQDQFITDHSELAHGVYETKYENGKSIIVNYNPVPYRDDLIEVGAEDFAIIEGGE